MFKNKSKENGTSTSSSSSASVSGSTNSLVAGTNVEGSINASSDIRIDGSLKGTLECKGRVIIGPEGKVDGEINCQNAVIEGKFQGKLNVKELLIAKESANIQGEVITDQLRVQPGAIFNVSCSMGGQTLKAFGKKEPLKVREGA